MTFGFMYSITFVAVIKSVFSFVDDVDYVIPFFRHIRSLPLSAH